MALRMASSQGARSASLSGVPRDILSMLAGGWEVSASANCQLSCAASRVSMVVLPSDLAEEFAKQHVEMVNAIFTLHGVTPAVVGRRAQTALNIFAEADVFLLDFIAEGHRALDTLLILRRSDIVEKPFEDGECFVVGERHNCVR